MPTQKQLTKYCRSHANTFNQFEGDFEKTFKTTLREENQKSEKQLVKLFNMPFTPTKYTPQNDYYTYINYSWLSGEAKELQKTNKFYTQIDSFRIVQEKVYYEIIDIVKNFIRVDKSRKAQEIKDVYTSFLNLNEYHFLPGFLPNELCYGINN
jgi:hypothetical protein